MNKKLVIFIGPPGSGKGTQAILSEKEFGFEHVESSQLIEDKFKNTKEGDPDWDEVEKERDLFDKGILNSPPFVAKLIVERVRRLAKEGTSIVLSGSPRTLYEAEKEMPVIVEEYGKENVIIIHIAVSEETSIARNSKRRICKKNRHPILYTPETKDLEFCPEDGSPLIDRGVLDDPETIKVRLEEYKERTEPVLEYARKESGIEPKLVDGEQSVESIFEKVKKIIEAV